MIGPNPGLEKEIVVGATAVTAYRIVKRGAAEDLVIHAAAVGDKSLGVAQSGGAVGARARVAVSGIAKIEYGGTVVQGDLITSDANGRGVVAAPAAGTNNRIVGIAMSDSVNLDIGTLLVQPSMLQG